MTESKTPQPTSPDTLAKTSPKGAVELSETQLAEAAGGAIYMAPAASSLKLGSDHKLDVDIGTLVPAVKPGL